MTSKLASAYYRGPGVLAEVNLCKLAVILEGS